MARPAHLRASIAVAMVFNSGLTTAACPDGGKVHLASYDSNMRSGQIFLRVSAGAHGFLNVAIAGTGTKARWGMGMEQKINTYREYVYRYVDDCEIVLLLDAGDVIVTGSPAEVEGRFRIMEAKWNRSLFFGGEAGCTQWGVPVCDELKAATEGRGTFRYLNSGLIVGRGKTLKALFANRLSEAIEHDQEWMRAQFLAHRDVFGIDYDTDLFLVPLAIDGFFTGSWLDDWGHQPAHAVAMEEEVDGRKVFVNRLSNTRPLILHFPGWGKFPVFIDRRSGETTHPLRWETVMLYTALGWEETCAINEVFQALFPTEAHELGLGENPAPWIGLFPGHRFICVGVENVSPFKAARMFYTTVWTTAQVAFWVGCVTALIAVLSCRPYCTRLYLRCASRRALRTVAAAGELKSV